MEVLTDTELQSAVVTDDSTAEEQREQPGVDKSSPVASSLPEKAVRKRKKNVMPHVVEIRTSQRRTTKTKQFDFAFSGNEEQLLIQQVHPALLWSHSSLLTWCICLQALRLSRRETKRVVHEPPDAPVFHPTSEEFAHPMRYIEK